MDRPVAQQEQRPLLAIGALRGCMGNCRTMPAATYQCGLAAASPWTSSFYSPYIHGHCSHDPRDDDVAFQHAELRDNGNGPPCSKDVVQANGVTDEVNWGTWPWPIALLLNDHSSTVRTQLVWTTRDKLRYAVRRNPAKGLSYVELSRRCERILPSESRLETVHT